MTPASDPPRVPPSGPGLYVHVPFCVRKCDYCDFASERLADPARVSLYLDMLEREIARLPPEFRPATVYVGGGTPTALPPPDLRRLLAAIAPLASGAIEWTVEANPGTVTAETARLLRDAGVNRVSLGVQSFDPATLAWLGRVHGPDDAAEAVRRFRDAGLQNLSLDLLLAVPARDAATLERDLDRTLSLAPTHVSAYLLSIEPGTPLAHRLGGSLPEELENQAVDDYQRTRRRLREAGFRQYEISNFARPGAECRHNLIYWTGGDYLGVGPAAHSHWQGSRWGNFQTLEAWAAALSKGWKPAEFEERLPSDRRARERLVFWLRLCGGVDRAAFRAAEGVDCEAIAGDALRRLAAQGLLRCDAASIRLADDALLISDRVFAELV